MKSPWRWCALAGAALLLSASAPLTAADDQAIPAERQAKFLEKYADADANGDGVLTRQEVRTHFASRHGKDAAAAHPPASQPAGNPGTARPRHQRPDHGMLLEKHPELDTDGDGTLSADELLAARKRFGPPPGAGFRGPGGRPDPKMLLEKHPELDTDGDGTLSIDELKAAREKFGRQGPGPQMRSPEEILKKFPEADANNDGSLSEEELAGFRDSMREKHQAEMSKRMLERFPEADTDGDGTLSPEEMKALHESQATERRAKLLERFPEADTDGDGTLSDAEMKAFAKEHRGAGPGPGERPAKRGPRGDRGFRNGGAEPGDAAPPAGPRKRGAERRRGKPA